MSPAVPPCPICGGSHLPHYTITKAGYLELARMRAAEKRGEK